MFKIKYFYEIFESFDQNRRNLYRKDLMLVKLLRFLFFEVQIESAL